MLVVGDAAIQEYVPEVTVKNIEIICGAPQKIFLKNYFKATSKGKKINNFLTKYKLPDNKNLYLYSYQGIDSLTYLIESTFAKGYKFKYADADTCYMFNIIRSSLIYKNVYVWKNILESTYKLYNSHIMGKRLIHSNFMFNLEANALRFCTLLTNDDKVETDEYKLKQFKLLSEEKLHDIYKGNSRVNYLDLKDDDGSFFIAKWTILNRTEKENICLERIYVIAVNEFIIPYYKEQDEVPANTTEILYKAYMIFINTINEKCLFKFLVYEYMGIVNRLNNYYYKIFENVIKD